MSHDQQQRARGAGLALVGYRGTGKSTVGRIVAARLRRAFFDADHEIEARAGVRIVSIFETQGESAFRDWEEQTLRALAREHPGAVVATGGGAVVRPANRLLLRDFGWVVWLSADPAELARRLSADPRAESRPALTAAGTIDEIAEVLKARRALYHEVADVEIDTSGRAPEDIADEVVSLWVAGGP